MTITATEYIASDAYYTFTESLKRIEKPPYTHEWVELPNHIKEIWTNAVEATEEFIFNEEEQNG